jgi:hypothetical protein
MDPLRIAKGGRPVADDLVAEIAGALAESGEYSAPIDLAPTQRVVDFHWAAHRAGRRLGMKVKVDVQVFEDSSDSRALVRVRPRRLHRRH